MSTASSTALITAEEFVRMDFDVPVELVRGEIVKTPRPGGVHGFVCNKVGRKLDEWAESNAAGAVASNDSGVVTERDPDTVRGPDVYFIRQDRLPGGRIPEGLLEIPPDLAVEVLSPHDRWRDVNEKVFEFIVSGVAEVWVVDPASRTIRVFPADGPPQTFEETETLVSPLVLPGFQCPVSAMFPSQ